MPATTRGSTESIQPFRLVVDAKAPFVQLRWTWSPAHWATSLGIQSTLRIFLEGQMLLSGRQVKLRTLRRFRLIGSSSSKRSLP